MAASEIATPEPPIDRSTMMRWVYTSVLTVAGIIGTGILVTELNSPICVLTTSDGATWHADGLYKALVLYAQDHDGRFPTAENNSNEAFRQLFPDTMTTERSFYVPRSAWHDAAPGKRPDDKIGSPPEYAECLQQGENHWAYVSGLNEKSAGDLPVVADGFVENEPGTYTDDPSKKGGVWKGHRAIVVFADGSAKKVPLSAKTHFRVLRTDPKAAKSVDIFTREGGLPEGAESRVSVKKR